MTLLLATVTESGILVTADGLSCATSLRDASGRATLQKVFPVPSHAIAIAQCGPNSLKVRTGKISLERWLGRFFEQLDADDVIAIARSVREGILSDEVEKKRNNRFFNKAAYLWIMGYSLGESAPELFCASEAGVRSLVDGEALPFRTCMGAGADLLSGCEWQNHDEAWLQATERQETRGKPVFGGRKHRVLVTPQGCRWEEPYEPMRGTLGLEMTLKRWGVSPTIDASFNDPRGAILSLREMLVDNLRRRALRDNGEHPSTYGGAREHWRPDSQPNWNLTDQLVAACDDAELADPEDVSQDDAQLYDALVRVVIKSLPPVVHPKR